AFARYSVTTFDPGARLVFTHGCRLRPRATAFLASRPAPIITLGFDVFVQLVIAAITTEPWSSVVIASGSATATAAPVLTADACAEPAASAPRFGEAAIIVGSAVAKPAFACFTGPRS